MRKTLLALVCLVATLSATAQSQEPNTVRYFLNDKTVFDIRLSELEQIKRIGKFGLRNVYSAEDKNSKDFLYSQIDSIMFVYVKYDDEVAPDVTNANRNQNPKAQGLEFPRLRSGSDQLLVQHSTKPQGTARQQRGTNRLMAGRPRHSREIPNPLLAVRLALLSRPYVYVERPPVVG